MGCPAKVTMRERALRLPNGGHTWHRWSTSDLWRAPNHQTPFAAGSKGVERTNTPMTTNWSSLLCTVHRTVPAYHRCTVQCLDRFRTIQHPIPGKPSHIIPCRAIPVQRIPYRYRTIPHSPGYIPSHIISHHALPPNTIPRPIPSFPFHPIPFPFHHIPCKLMTLLAGAVTVEHLDDALGVDSTGFTSFHIISNPSSHLIQFNDQPTPSQFRSTKPFPAHDAPYRGG